MVLITTTTENVSNSAYSGSSYSGLPNELVKAANGVDYAYRDTGPTACRWSFCSTSAETSTTGTLR